MQDGVWVEKITRYDTGAKIYRITVALQGESKTIETHIPYHADNRETEETIKHGVISIFTEWGENAFRQILENKRRTGSFDNTTEMYRREQQEMQRSYEEQVRRSSMCSPFRGLSAQQALAGQAMLQQQYNAHMYGNWADLPYDYTNRQSKNKALDKINRKSMALLFKTIGKLKSKQFKKKGYFEHIGKHGVFKFMKDDAGGVKLIQTHTFGGKERKVEWSLCVQSAKADMPKGDVILSRYLECITDEDKFVETANFRNINTADEATERTVI